jgi:hypothetical protein
MTVDRLPPLGPGLYPAVLTDTYESTSPCQCRVLVFTINGGQFDGECLTYRLWSPEHERSEGNGRREEMARRQNQLLVLRLGLTGDGECPDFREALNRQFILNVEKRQIRGHTFIGVAFDGIYPPDHPRLGNR